MAVNGIEINVGQTWRTRGGTEVRIIDFDVEDAHSVPSYSWRTDSQIWLNESGKLLAHTTHEHDLVELIGEINEPQEIRFEPGDAGTRAIEMLTDLGWVFTDGLWVQEQPRSVKQTAPDLLSKAAKIMSDRATTYDKPEGERSMGATVAAFNIIARRDLTESEGWLLMQILKDVRDRQRVQPHVDSLEDCVAYSALKAEARLAEKQKE